MIASWNASPSSIQLPQRAAARVKPGPTRVLPAGRSACRAIVAPAFSPSLLALLEADRGSEEPLHLFAEAVGVAPDPSPPRVQAELAHEGGERRAQFQPSAAGPDGLGGHPEEQESG